VNTLDNPNNYRVTFWSGGELVSFSSFASSVFLELIPDDNQMTLIMNHEVPWTNETYEVYRQEPSGGAFNLVGTATEAMYTDTGLVNNVSYCWFVRSIGTYGTPGVIDPLINDSQIACGKPYDLTPPCPPEITVDGDCESETVLIVWTNPNNSCADDVMGYRLYYAPVEGEDLLLYAEFDFENDTVFVFNEDGEIGSIAGCYAVTALDSLLEGPDGNLRRNESVLSDIFCVDNCPIYLLPNIFTPNNDGVNDVFIPYPYRFIESIDFQVFNRWGGLVYKTADPAIGWDGTDQTTGQVCTDGTYFYTVTANTIRLTGIVPEKFSGTIQLSDGKNPVQE
ncbi:MAG: gliding motility-associated C-terminal domain-containing protein, partial [Flavobacteriales bacterium]|nr:gliding motility-associated C-terminal domain-containing protein [Flavobacteriales bacterium]